MRRSTASGSPESCSGDAYASVPELCPHLHLPVQSGSSRLLEAMNRRYDRDHYLERVDRLRKTRPDLALTTDLIVGFPGETDEDFQHLEEYIDNEWGSGQSMPAFAPSRETMG